MKRLAFHLHAHRRFALSLAVGAVSAGLVPGEPSLVTRALVGWNVAVWLYLGWVGWMMRHADHGQLRRVAAAQAESAGTLAAIVSVASVASLLGIVAELSTAKGATQGWQPIGFTLLTVLGSWLLLPVSFTLIYASVYYRDAHPHGSGLQFPGAGASFAPDYNDFLYFAFTIAVAAQTSDVAVTSTAMRQRVLLHAVVSFGFNTAILALAINLAAGLL
jgi:uncharacterized membrane protein